MKFGLRMKNKVFSFWGGILGNMKFGLRMKNKFGGNMKFGLRMKNSFQFFWGGTRNLDSGEHEIWT